MSEEKCEFYNDGECELYHKTYNYKLLKTCIGSFCVQNKNCHYKQLQAAKKENEKLMEQLNTKYLKWEETFIENQNLTQQNKQMRVAINNIKNICNEDWEDMTVDKSQNQLLQALKGGE